MSNPGNVIGGHKANLSNPNTSEESKQHSKEVIEGAGSDAKTSSSTTSDGKNTSNVLAGHKANISNPNTSEESKQHSQEVLDGSA